MRFTSFPFFYTLADVQQTVALSKDHVQPSMIMRQRMIDWRNEYEDDLDDGYC